MSSASESTARDAGNRALIELDGVGLRFRRYGDAIPSLKQTLLNRLRGVQHGVTEEHWLYRDLAIRIESGEAVGIIGANGAGKSTLLKLIAGIYPPTVGRIHVRGNIASLIEISAGLNPELTGMENISLLGALMGKSERMMARRTDFILEFAGLKEYAHSPVKYYSSGMQMRLAFSIATDIEPEVLLVDEVFAAGDEEFVQKAMSRMRELVETAHIVILVSHNMTLVTSFMRRVIWIDQGRIVRDGDPGTISEAYLAFERAKP